MYIMVIIIIMDIVYIGLCIIWVMYYAWVMSLGYIFWVYYGFADCFHGSHTKHVISLHSDEEYNIGHTV